MNSWDKSNWSERELVYSAVTNPSGDINTKTVDSVEGAL